MALAALPWVRRRSACDRVRELPLQGSQIRKRRALVGALCRRSWERLPAVELVVQRRLRVQPVRLTIRLEDGESERRCGGGAGCERSANRGSIAAGALWGEGKC